MKIKLFSIALMILILLSLLFNQVVANQVIENNKEAMNSRIINRIFILGILDEPIILEEKEIQIDAKILFRVDYFRYMFRHIDLAFHFDYGISISYGASGNNTDLNFVGYYNDNFVCGILIYRFA